MTPVEGRMSSSDAGGASIALQRSVRALDGVERIGRLLTLDLKGNEIKVSASCIQFLHSERVKQRYGKEKWD